MNEDDIIRGIEMIEGKEVDIVEGMGGSERIILMACLDSLFKKETKTNEITGNKT